MAIGKSLDLILTDISEDARKYLKDGFSKVLIIGKEENYQLFRKFFNKRTHSYYSKRIEYSETKKGIEKDIYPIFIDSFL